MFISRSKLISGFFLATVIISTGYILYAFLHSSGDQHEPTDPVPVQGTANDNDRNSRWETDTGEWNASFNTPDPKDRKRTKRKLPDSSVGRVSRESSEAPWPGGPSRSDLAGSLFDRLHLPSGMTEDDIPPEYQDCPEDFLDRVEEVGEEELSDSDKEGMDQVFFTTARPDTVDGPVFFTDLFSPYSNRIYGAFYSVTDNLTGRDRVLVKWTGTRGDLLLYEYMTITPSLTFNYVWREGYWDTGIYVLTLYGLEDDIKPLAYGTYRVEMLPQFIGHLDLFEDPGQGVTQSDFAFGSRIILSFSYAVEEDTPAALAVYKIETGEYIIDEDIVLPAADPGTYNYVLKEPEDPTFPFGTFKVEVWTDREFPVGQNQFIHHE